MSHAHNIATPRQWQTFSLRGDPEYRRIRVDTATDKLRCRRRLGKLHVRVVNIAWQPGSTAPNGIRRRDGPVRSSRVVDDGPRVAVRHRSV